MSVNTPLTNLVGKKIFVGLSGGVDSAVTAALLKQAGAHVTAVFIKGWYPPGMPCTWAADRRDAMRVAAHLRIPFLTLDASAEYKKSVIDYLLSEYKAGRTPNPDIMCNREVKFGAFHAFAHNNGADFIATGHYAMTALLNDTPRLLRSADEEKDQNYFLWAVPSEALSHTLFPLGSMHKVQVRELAAKMKLPNALKRDSQGICFLGNISVEEFLQNEFGTSEGKAIDEAGQEIGTHSGVLLSTLGQRVRLENAPPGPWYVISKDIEKNILTVSHQHASDSRNIFELDQTNWFQGPLAGKTYTAQYRYHGPKIKGVLNAERNEFTPSIPVNEPIASGQSLVIYDEEECIGGGIIA